MNLILILILKMNQTMISSCLCTNHDYNICFLFVDKQSKLTKLFKVFEFFCFNQNESKSSKTFYTKTELLEVLQMFYFDQNQPKSRK